MNELEQAQREDLVRQVLDAREEADAWKKKYNEVAIAHNDLLFERSDKRPFTLTPEEAWLFVHVAVTGQAGERGEEFKAILQRLCDAVGYEPPVPNAWPKPRAWG
jgi:hypothetical protein